MTNTVFSSGTSLLRAGLPLVLAMLCPTTAPSGSERQWTMNALPPTRIPTFLSNSNVREAPSAPAPKTFGALTPVASARARSEALPLARLRMPLAHPNGSRTSSPEAR